MKIKAQLGIGFAAITAGLAAAMQALPSLTGSSWGPENLMLLAILLSVIAMMGLMVLLSRTVLAPLKEVTEAVKSLAKGGFRQKIFRGKITKSSVKNADELRRTLLMLEIMRRKVLEVQRNMGDSMKEKALEMQRINDELKENEEVLKKANAQLAAQAEEFERMNRELSTTNEDLVEANTKLQELDKMKDDFVTVAAEELCSPLVPILESVDDAESGTLSEEEAWKTIVAESKRLGIVASSIVDVSRIEDGTYSYDMHPLSVKQLLDGIVQTSSGLKGRDGVTANIKLDSDPAGDVMIVADKKRLHSALGGIINNSIRFSKNAVITIGSRANHLSGSVEIRIADNGPRFPPDLLPELFNKYTTRTREDERGTGLGLFITKAIIEAHGGTIRIESHKGARTKGVSFVISLPMKVQKVQPTSAEAGAGAAN